MLLSDRDIKASIAEGRLGLEPYDARLVQPSSIDVRLDRFFRVFNNSRYTHIDPALQQDDLTTLVEPDGDEPFVLHPGEFVLGSTLEVVTIPDDLAARLEGKSSLGRLGLLTHSTAGFVDPGFSGHITLELSNVANLPITLWPGMKIGQLCMFRLSSPAEHPYGSAVYGSRYQDQRGPTPSRSYRNFTRAETRRPLTCTVAGGSAPAHLHDVLAASARLTSSPAPRRRRTAARVDQPAGDQHQHDPARTSTNIPV